MKTRQLVFGLVGIVGLAIAFVVGLHLQAPPPSRNPKDRLITISASPGPDAGKCEVDYPVAFLRYNQGHTVQWASTDNQYWISFREIAAPPGTAESPFENSAYTVIVDSTHPSQKYRLKHKEKYYMYAIFDHDPTLNNQNPCKAANEDHDTGLNIKP
jgi:hypothetical protein